MPKITTGTIVKLILACLAVGIVLSTLGVDPRNILSSGKAAVEWLISVAGQYVGGAVTYILLGAVVVIPIWLIMYLLKAVRGRN